MKRMKKALLIGILVSFALGISAITVFASITENEIGTHDGYDYEFWRDYGGYGNMTLNAGGTFTAEWSDVHNILFRKGQKFDETQSHQQLGNISVDFGADYQPSGNSYLAIYGWTVDPLVEYYIIDSWGNWRPPGADPKGTVYIDGDTYDIYETTRVNEPSIIGDTTFQQYWSVRRNKRTEGTISVTEHFEAWEAHGMPMGNMYEVALTVEGWESSGYADVYRNNLHIGGSGGGGDNGGGDNGGGDPGYDDSNWHYVQDMNLDGPYAGHIDSPFYGVGFYANGDSASFTHYFDSNNSSFSLHGASDNDDNMARVDLRVGGDTIGTFYFGDSNPAVYTIDNVYHGTGYQEVELIMTADDGSWNAFVDYLEIH